MKKVILFLLVLISVLSMGQAPQRFNKVIVTGDITSPKFIRAGSTVDSVLLGNGSARAVSSIKTDTTHLSARINLKEPANANIQTHISSTSNPHSVTKSQVGLGNVDNTTDLNKPISTTTQNALNTKEGTITAGTTTQYYRGDKTFQTLDKTTVGLSNVDNTSDTNKPISTATQTALNGKQSEGTYSTDIHSNISALNAVIGINHGDETLTSIKTKLGSASSSNSGYLLNTDWSTFNGKQNQLTLGNLTSSVASMSVTGGTGAVIGSGVQLSIPNASTTTDGIMLHADWNTFNSKQPAGSYLRNNGYLTSNQDLNSLQIGMNANGGNSGNNAPNGNAYGVAFTISVDPYYGWQMYQDNTGEIHSRSAGVGTWVGWRKILDDTNFTPANYIQNNPTSAQSGSINLTGSATFASTIQTAGITPTNLSTGYIPMKSSGALVDSPIAALIGNVGIGYSSGTEIANNKLAVNGKSYFSDMVNIGYTFDNPDLTGNQLAVNGNIYSSNIIHSAGQMISDDLITGLGDIKAYGNFIKNGGTSSQFLKADGSVDSNVYPKLSSTTYSQFIPVFETTGSTSNNLVDSQISVSSGSIIFGNSTSGRVACDIDVYGGGHFNGQVTSSSYMAGKLAMTGIAPTSSSSTGLQGEIRYDSNYIYVCIATDTWKRSPLTTF